MSAGTSSRNETLPCGCKIDTIGTAFMIDPCSWTCPNYLFVLAEARRQDKPIQPLVDPEFQIDNVGLARRLGLTDNDSTTEEE